ncbi:hypothetical protein PR048_024769, partial [Dryococelus australis]
MKPSMRLEERRAAVLLPGMGRPYARIAPNLANTTHQFTSVSRQASRRPGSGSHFRVGNKRWPLAVVGGGATVSRAINISLTCRLRRRSAGSPPARRDTLHLARDNLQPIPPFLSQPHLQKSAEAIVAQWLELSKWGSSGLVDINKSSGAAVAQWLERFKVGQQCLREYNYIKWGRSSPVARERNSGAAETQWVENPILGPAGARHPRVWGMQGESGSTPRKPDGTSGIVQHDSHMRGFGSEPTGYRAQIAVAAVRQGPRSFHIRPAAREYHMCGCACVRPLPSDQLEAASGIKHKVGTVRLRYKEKWREVVSEHDLRSTGVPADTAALQQRLGVAMTSNQLVLWCCNCQTTRLAPRQTGVTSGFSCVGNVAGVDVGNQVDFFPQQGVPIAETKRTGSQVVSPFNCFIVRLAVCVCHCLQRALLLAPDIVALLSSLVSLPPTKANRVQSPAGSPDFRKWESCRTMSLVGGFSRGPPICPAPSFRRGSILTSITLVGSQDLAVNSRPNIFTHSKYLTHRVDDACDARAWVVLSVSPFWTKYVLVGGMLNERVKRFGWLLKPRVTRDEYGPAPECKGGGNGRSVRKLTDQRKSFFQNRGRGGRVVSTLTSHQDESTKANRVESPAGSPHFRTWESCRTMPLVAGFSRGSPVSPALSIRCCSILTSITLIGSQDLAVYSLPNLSTPLLP